jgi:HAD superfamily hydrolase (TIGR01549 family)
MIQTLLVDCDGTLHDNRLRLERQAKAVKDAFGLTEGDLLEAYFDVHSRVHAEFRERHDDIALHFELIAEAAARPIERGQAEMLAKKWREAYDEYQAAPVVFPDVRDFLAQMQKMGVELVLVSGSTEQERWELLKNMKIDGFFSRVFAANTLGCQKRDPSFYQIVIATLGIPAEQIGIVGDDPEDDLSAKRVGIYTLYLQRSSNGKPAGPWEADYIVHSLSEVAEALSSSAAHGSD